jgi:hypothetical protein
MRLTVGTDVGEVNLGFSLKVHAPLLLDLVPVDLVALALVIAFLAHGAVAGRRFSVGLLDDGALAVDGGDHGGRGHAIPTS